MGRPTCTKLLNFWIFGWNLRIYKNTRNRALSESTGLCLFQIRGRATQIQSKGEMCTLQHLIFLWKVVSLYNIVGNQLGAVEIAWNNKTNGNSSNGSRLILNNSSVLASVKLYSKAKREPENYLVVHTRYGYCTFIKCDRYVPQRSIR